MNGIADAWGRTAPITMKTGTYPVRELTLGDLVDLQEWAALQVPPPWAFADPDDPGLAGFVLYQLAKSWPPRVDDGSAEREIGEERWTARVLMHSPGLTADVAEEEAAWLATPQGYGARMWLRSTWWGTSPRELADKLIACRLGREPGDETDATDWPRLVADLCGRFNVLPDQLRGLSLTALRTLGDRGKHRSIGYSVDDLARIAPSIEKARALADAELAARAARMGERKGE